MFATLSSKAKKIPFWIYDTVYTVLLYHFAHFDITYYWAEYYVSKIIDFSFLWDFAKNH